MCSSSASEMIGIADGRQIAEAEADAQKWIQWMQ